MSEFGWVVGAIEKATGLQVCELNKFWMASNGIPGFGWAVYKTVNVFDNPQMCRVFIFLQPHEYHSSRANQIPRLVEAKTIQALNTLKEAIHDRQKYVI